MTTVSREAFRFFYENAGYCVGRRAAGAWHLARAEQEAAEMGVTFQWEFDQDGDLGDHEYWCRKDCGKDHEVLVCIALAPEGDALGPMPLASLGGIIDPGKAYGRVVEAELALEAVERLAPAPSHWEAL